ncbi:MAG: sigma-70 family RNA polymerase sigma factor [Fibrobacteria bacterium]
MPNWNPASKNADQGLEVVYRNYRDMIFRICSRYCKERAEAEDLTQETFLQVEKGLAKFRGDAELETWIYRICTNCCLAYLRTRQRRKDLLGLYLDSRVIRNLNLEGDRVLAKIDLDRILCHYRPLVRHVLFLTLAEGLSYRETGEVLGISPSAAAKTVERFLKKFRSGNQPTVGGKPLPEAIRQVVNPDLSDSDAVVAFRTHPANLINE